jgi:hypothetical protein
MKVRALHLLLSFKRWEKREELLAKLEKGINIIAENYSFSTVADSSANVLQFIIVFREWNLNGAYIRNKDYPGLIWCYNWI